MDEQRILLCPSSFYPNVGGVEELTLNLALGLKKRGSKVMILTNRHPSTLPETELIQGVEIRRVLFPYPRRSWLTATQLWAFLQACLATFAIACSFKPTLLHVVCAGPNILYALLLHRFLRIPLMLTSCGELFMDDGNLYKSRFARFILGQALVSADACSGVSQFVMTNLKDNFSRIPDLSRVVYPGIDIGYAIQKSNHSSIRSFVLSVARFVPNKGLITLIESFAKISSMVQQDLIIAGRGSLKCEAERRIRELGMESRIRILDAPDRQTVLQLYSECDFFVLPSPQEPFAIAMLEAMRASKAVLVSDGGGSSELVKSGVNGSLFKSGSSDSLAESLLLMCTNPGLSELGAAARSSVAPFDWEFALNKYQQIYAEISR